MSRSQPARPVVLGGGLTGIAAALHLGRRTLLVEAQDRLGGHARSHCRDGFTFDETGHWLHLRHPWTRALARRLLGDRLVPVERRARVFSHGVLTRYPFQANLHGLPPAVAAECLLGLVRARLAEAAAPPPPPADFEEYSVRHFGAGIARHFMVPYNTKLWGVHPREITAEWCSRFVPLPDLEEVVRGAVGHDPPELGYNAHFLYPREGGIETLVRALAARLRCQVRLGCPAERLDWRRRTVVAGGETIPWTALVTTLPLPLLCGMLVDPPAEIAEAAARLRWTAVRYLDVATRRRPPADFHWIYAPEERYPFYRVGIYSNAVPSMAPRGRGSLYVELSERGGRPRLEPLLRKVVPALVAAGAMASADDLLFADLREIEWAYVVFDPHHAAATARIHAFLERHRIFSRGRYGSWTYNSMEDCLLLGREVARTIASLPLPEVAA